MTKAKFVDVNPVLPVRKVAAAIEYYVDKLGFTLLFKDSEKDPHYAGVKRDHVELHLQWHDPAEFENVEKPLLRFIIDDVNKLFEEYEEMDAFHARTALRETPWGTREFAFYDPDKNGLTFYRDL